MTDLEFTVALLSAALVLCAFEDDRRVQLACLLASGALVYLAWAAD